MFTADGTLIVPQRADLQDLSERLSEELSSDFRAAIVQTLCVEWGIRTYFLFEGPLGEFGWTMVPTSFMPELPDLFWPKDYAWFVGTDVDLSYTLIGGTEELIAELMAEPNLSVSSIRPSDALAEIHRETL